MHLAGKSTLKDWKRAIRMNGIMLRWVAGPCSLLLGGGCGGARDAHVRPHRKIMDSGELDFYQHDKVCSNTCRSTKIDLSGARVSLSSPTAAEYLPLTPATADGMCVPAGTTPPCSAAGGWGAGGACAPLLLVLRPPRPRCARWAGLQFSPMGKSQAFFQRPFVKKHVSPVYRSVGRTQTPTSPTPGPRRSLLGQACLPLGPGGHACDPIPCWHLWLTRRCPVRDILTS